METPITSLNTDDRQELPLTIPVIEEYVVVKKKVVEAGKIKVVKQVAEVAEDVNISLLHDEYEVEHVPVNLFVDGNIPSVRHEGDTMIVPVLKEVIVKRTLLVEEIRVKRRIVTETSQQTVSLRKETVTVEHTGVSNSDTVFHK